MEVFYYIVGTIVSVCSLLAVLISIMKNMFYEKIEGKVLENKIDNVNNAIIEIKKLIENLRDKN